MNELEYLTKNLNPDVIAVSEVLPKNFKNTVYKEQFNIEGYDMIPHTNVEKNIGRGSIMYIKKDIPYKEVILDSKFSNFEEVILAEINLNKNDRILCVNVYRRGESSELNNNLLLDIIDSICNKKYSHIIIMGDFNLKQINWEESSCPGENTEDFNHKFIECIRDNFLFQHVTEPTRKRGQDEPSTLDLIFTNEENMVKDLEYLPPLGRSDHSVIKFNIPCARDIREPKIIVKYEKGNYKEMNEELGQINWEEEFKQYPNDVNRQWTVFSTKFHELEKKYVPRKNVFINGKKSKKLSTALDRKTLRKIKRKNNLWGKIRKKIASEEEELQYKKITNQIRRLTRKAKKLTEQVIAKNSKNNPKAFWKYTQSKLKTKASIPDLQKPNPESNESSFTTSDGEKAEVFLNYFSSVFTNEPDDDMPYFEKREYKEVLENINITEDMILKKLKDIKINKSPGPDQIHPRVLHEISEALTKPLVIIFNTSLRNQELPSEWKHANVSAIFKKGKKTFPQNYRPISLTCILCKIMESIIRDSIIQHMRSNKLFSPKQFGFLNERSTILQLLHVLNIWTEILDQGGSIDTVYCDFMKAFDKVPHKRLLHKIEKYGISGNIMGWINSFLSNRSQCVNINSSKSTSAPVTSGIPQGSVLGPILFVIYINDLPEVVDKNSFVFLFADDTKVFRKVNSNEDAKMLQNDIDNLIAWSDKWLLKFHPDKCVYMGLGYNKAPIEVNKYNMGGQFLKTTECEKDIGVNIDSKLSFETHINGQIKIANRILAITRKTFNFMDCKIFNNIFKGMVRPHLEYGAPIWSPHLAKHIHSLENVQMRAIKMVPGLSKLKTYPARLRKLKLPTLAYRRLRGDMIQVYKLVAKGYDKSLPNLFTSQESESNLRGHAYKLPVERYRLDIKKYNFTTRVRKIWNDLPEKVLNSSDVKAFEIALDKHWEDQDLMYDNYKAAIRLSGQDKDFVYAR